MGANVPPARVSQLWGWLLHSQPCSPVPAFVGDCTKSGREGRCDLPAMQTEAGRYLLLRRWVALRGADKFDACLPLPWPPSLARLASSGTVAPGLE